MKLANRKHQTAITVAVLALFSAGAALLPGCPGLTPPPVPVAFDVVLGVEVPAIAVVSGRADIDIEEICDLFDDAELEAMIRAEAGSLITDMMEIKRVMLVSTDITATEGTFEDFTTASLDVVDDARNETLLLGTAANNNGLGTSFLLQLNNPVDLRNDLDAEDCEDPELHIEGADFFEGESITFDVGVQLLVYTEFPEN